LATPRGEVNGSQAGALRARACILRASMGVPKALTIAGSDSGGGAGIQADLKTFSAFRVFGMSVITAVTAQNSLGVQGVFNLPPEFVGRQIDSVLSDFGADAIKIGMLATAPIIAVIAERLRAHPPEKSVLGPVVIAKSGAAPALELDPRDGLYALVGGRGGPGPRPRAEGRGQRGEGVRDRGDPRRLPGRRRRRRAPALRHGLVGMARSVDDAKMSFMEHLGELRTRIVRGLIALLVGTVIVL